MFNFKLLYPAIYIPNRGFRQIVRDPSVIEIGNYYYIIHTVTTSQTDKGKCFGCCRTKDFKKYEELDNVVIDSVNGLSEDMEDWGAVWAPAFHFDVKENKYYIVMTLVGATGEGAAKYQSAVGIYNPEDNSISEVTGLNIKFLDVHILYRNGAYYAIDGANIYKSSTLLGTYERIKYFDWNTKPDNFEEEYPGVEWKGYEACFPLILPNGKVRIYREPVGVGGARYTYMDSVTEDIEGEYTSSKFVNVIGDFDMTHFTIIDTKKVLPLNVIDTINN